MGNIFTLLSSEHLQSVVGLLDNRLEKICNLIEALQVGHGDIKIRQLRHITTIAECIADRGWGLDCL